MNKKTFRTNLNDIAAVKKFVKIANMIPVDVTVSEGKYVIDGKSIMGIFSLDLSKPVMVTVQSEYVECFDFEKEIVEGE